MLISTKYDIDLWPGVGRRFELIDGCLVVTPPSSARHQFSVSRLLVLLSAAAPEPLLVLVAPTDVTFSPGTTLQPDLLVVERSRSLAAGANLQPLLVVEVLSPSTRRIDLTLKRDRYEAAGTPAYWVVDPEAPSITAWTLTDGRYGDPVIVTGDETLRVAAPFEITIAPIQLVP